jgi:tetratricopeptide (TPR) repeat protein
MNKFTYFTSIALVSVQTVLAQRNDVRKLVKDAFASNDQIQAVAHLDQAYQEDSEDFVEELAFTICNDKEKARTALPLLSTLIKRHPDDKYLYHLRGCGKVVLGDYDNAIVDASKVVEIEPLFSAAYGLRAFAFAQKGDEISCLRDKEAKLDAEKKLEMALTTCEAKIKDDPFNITLYIERARYRELQGKKQDAKADRQKAAELQKEKQEREKLNEKKLMP